MKTTCPCRKYCSGVSVVSKIIEGLQPSSDWPTVVLDMFGLDGFAAMHCLVQNSNGIKALYFLAREFSFRLCLDHFWINHWKQSFVMTKAKSMLAQQCATPLLKRPMWLVAFQTSSLECADPRSSNLLGFRTSRPRWMNWSNFKNAQFLHIKFAWPSATAWWFRRRWFSFGPRNLISMNRSCKLSHPTTKSSTLHTWNVVGRKWNEIKMINNKNRLPNACA